MMTKVSSTLCLFWLAISTVSMLCVLGINCEGNSRGCRHYDDGSMDHGVGLLEDGRGSDRQEAQGVAASSLGGDNIFRRRCGGNNNNDPTCRHVRAPQDRDVVSGDIIEMPDLLFRSPSSAPFIGMGAGTDEQTTEEPSAAPSFPVMFGPDSGNDATGEPSALFEPPTIEREQCTVDSQGSYGSTSDGSGFLLRYFYQLEYDPRILDVPNSILQNINRGVVDQILPSLFDECNQERDIIDATPLRRLQSFDTSAIVAGISAQTNGAVIHSDCK